MDVNKMTVKDFKKLRRREWAENIGTFDALIILPGDGRQKHDSGYRYIDFIATKGQKPICRLAGGSDVLHINGIGGYGKNIKNIKTGVVPVVGWNIDCLPKSGLLRLWCDKPIVCGAALSSFEVYVKDK